MSGQLLPAAIATVFEAFNAGDLDRAAAVASEDFELVDVAQGLTLYGPSGLRQWLQPWLIAAPDAQTTIMNIVVDGNRVATEHIGRGTHTGPLHGPAGVAPATGKTFELRIAETYEIRGDKLIRMCAYYDLGTFLRQLGLMS